MINSMAAVVVGRRNRRQINKLSLKLCSSPAQLPGAAVVTLVVASLHKKVLTKYNMFKSYLMLYNKYSATHVKYETNRNYVLH